MNDLKGIIEDCNKSDLISDKVIKKIIEIIGQEEWQELHDENNDVCTTMGELIITLKGITELEKENAELKEVHESDKRSLALIAKKGADFEKAYNEAEELLDKQIEATYKVVEENKELKEKLGDVQMQKAGEKSDLVWKLKTANEQKAEQLTYAKTIIQDLLDNTDEYARQRAEDFLKENK